MTTFRHLSRPGAWLALLLGLMLCTPMTSFAIDPVEMSTPQLQERYRALSLELRCMQCQNQSIADSPVSLAGDLRRQVRELLEAGKSDAEIREHMRQRYGDFILFRPVVSWRNAWLWITPVILLIGGLWVAWRVLRRRAQLLESDESDPDEKAPA